MPQREIVVTTADGECPAVLVTPDGEGPWPAVIVFMDAGGLRPAMVEIGQRLADLGYVALVPELYYRSGPYAPFDMATAFGDERERKRLFGLMSALTKEAAARDGLACIDHLSGLPEVIGGKIGTTGYCMGGGISLTVAARHPDRVAAAASFHGGNLASDAPDSPHLIAGNITAATYIAAASNDGSFPAEQEQRLLAALDGGGVPYTFETYPALHGFAVTDNGSYDAECAERHYRALADLYGSALA